MKRISVRKILLVGAAGVIFSLCGCSSLPRVNSTHPWLTEGKRPRVALVLSGGASKGFAHVGVIRALEQEKIPVDFIVGTSVGSLIGALYSSSKSSFDLEWLVFDLKEEDLFDFTIFSPTQGFVKGEKLVSFLHKKIGRKNFSDLNIPLYVTATNLQTGKLVVISSGPVDTAVLASASIPVVFPPVVKDGAQLVDGGVVDNIPADVARELGADIVIAVDISAPINNPKLTNIKDYTMQSISIMMSINSQSKLKYADVVIRPEIKNVGIWDFSKKKELLVSGIEAAQSMMPEIKKAFNDWYRKR